MDPVELHLSLDREAGAYRGLERVEGTLEVHVQEACECRAFTVRLSWLAKSRYDEDQGRLPEVILEGGTLQPGQRHALRFALDLPPAVWSYQGQKFSLDYAVEAKADLVNAADVHARVPIQVLPAASLTAETIAPYLGVIGQPVEGGALALAADRSIAADQAAARFGPGCLIGSGIFAFLVAIPFIGVAALFYRALQVLAESVGSAVLLIGMVWLALGVLMPLGFGCVLIYLGARHYLAAWMLGKVDVEVPERLVAPGERVHVAVRIRPQRECEIQRVTATLRARETVWRSGKNGRRAERQTVRAEERTLEGARAVRAGDLVELSGTLDVPMDASYSLGAPNHWLEWHVVVHVALRGWIDQESEHLVTIAPIAGQDRES